ncbi:MAG: hypothetical protein NBV63_00765 [Candidatus Pacebacteria bacterium]|jgi:hypothetical protein|nr:hypothetical protein [Candidatus Paceibacterota bacterium]
MQKINIDNHGASGLLWLTGWLFTVGYLSLGFWDGVWAFFIWPYYIGSHLSLFGF